MEPFTTEQIRQENQTSRPSMEYWDHEPGDCTRYPILYGTYEDPYYGTRYVLTYLNRGTGGRSFVWDHGMTVDLSDFMEKTGICNTTTAAVLLRFMENKGHPVYECRTLSNYNQHGLWVGRTE